MQLTRCWQETTLGEICRGGFIQTGPFGSQLHAHDYIPTGVPVVMPVNIGDGRVIEDRIARVSEADASRLARHRMIAGDIVYSRRGDITRRALVTESENGWLCGTGCLLVRPGSAVDPRWLSYWLGSPWTHEFLMRRAVGATMPNLNTGILSELPVRLPSLAEQRRIAGVLGALDDLIETNQKLLRDLVSQSNVIYLASLNRGASTTTLDNVASFENRLRVPLSAAERLANPGPFPYYGATCQMDSVGDYLFDGTRVLVGEDGSVVDADGSPIVQYVFGKFWVNNHAHVLIGRGISTELLRVVLSHAKVGSVITGAVQAKLSMGNLKTVPIRIPLDPSVDTTIQVLTRAERELLQEIDRLTNARDELLPLLLSGRVRVGDVAA